MAKVGRIQIVEASLEESLLRLFPKLASIDCSLSTINGVGVELEVPARRCSRYLECLKSPSPFTVSAPKKMIPANRRTGFSKSLKILLARSEVLWKKRFLTSHAPSSCVMNKIFGESWDG